MKIAFITFDYPPLIEGGAGVYSANLARGLARFGQEVHVITPRPRRAVSFEARDGVFVHRIRFLHKPLLSAPSFWIGLRREFPGIEREFGPFDVIHGDTVAAFSLNSRSVPRILTIHHLARSALKTMNPSFFYRICHLGAETGLAPYIERICINRADKIITVSNYTKDELITTYNVPENKVEVIYIGMKEGDYEFSKGEKREIREQFALPTKPIVMFVGRLEEKRKGLPFLLEAFRQVLSQEVDTQLLIVGAGRREPYEQLASSLGIDRNITFAGRVDDIILRKLYSVADVVACPSSLEGFGLIPLEALTAGKQVVATRVGAIPEMVQGEEGVSLVDYGDVDALANAICRCLNNNSWDESLAKRQARRVKERFGWEQCLYRTVAVYEKALGRVR